MSCLWLVVLLCGAAAATVSGQSARDLAIEEQEARQAMAAKRYGDAISIYQSMLAARPGEPSIRFNLAVALHFSGHYREAVKQLEAIRESASENPNFWFLLGVGYLKLGQPDKSIDPLQHAVRLSPPNVEARIELADAFLEIGQLEPAAAAFSKLASDYPKLPKAWEGLCTAELALSHEAFGRLERLAPQSSFRYGLAAEAAAVAGNTPKAIDLYRQALTALPDAPWLHFELKQLQEAQTAMPAPNPCPYGAMACDFFAANYRAVIADSARADTPEALYWRCRAYGRLARESMERLAALPPSPEQHEMLAKAYSQLGERTEAIAELQKAAKLQPESILIHSELAKALWQGRQYEQAVALLDSLLASSAEEPEWQYQLGDALFHLGKPEEAITHLNIAISIAPKLLAAQARLGEALLQMGRPSEAVTHLELAQSLDKDGSIHFQLATAYRRLGKTALASRAAARQKELESAAESPQ